MDEEEDSESVKRTGPAGSTRQRLGIRVLVAMSLRLHMLQCETHLKGGGLPALFPLSGCTPPPLPVTSRCVRGILSATVGTLEEKATTAAALPGDRGASEALKSRAGSLRRVLDTLSGAADPSVTLLFNPLHPTLGRLLRRHNQDTFPSTVLYDGAVWHIPLSPVVLAYVRKPDPTVFAREVDFGTRGRQIFRPVPSTHSPSAGRYRCSDPAVFASATHGAFSVEAAIGWERDGNVWTADPGEY